MKVMSTVVFVLLIVSLAQAQSWPRTYGGGNVDYGYSVQPTSDGGFIIAGCTFSFGAGEFDVYLIRTNSSGDTLWTRTYGGTADEKGFSVRPTSDGGYIIAGVTQSFGAGNSDVYLIKTDASGDTLWTRTYGGPADDEGYSVQQTTDGGYIIAGMTESFGAGFCDVYLIKTNAFGDTLWTRTYGGSNNDWGYSVQPTLDGGYIVAGYTFSFGAGDGDVYLIKTNALGDTLWTRTYGGTGNDEGFAVQQTSDTGYIIAGCTNSFGAGEDDVYLIKTNALGDTIWTRTYGGNGDDEGFSVQQTLDGGYIVAGFTASFGAGDGDVYLIRASGAGEMDWTKTYGGTCRDEGHSVQQTSDGGYIVAGCTSSSGAGAYDVYLIKTDADGNVGTDDDIACTGIQQPDIGVAAGRPVLPVLTIMNDGIRAQSDIPVDFWIDSSGSRVYTGHGTLTGPLLPQSTAQCTLTAPWTPCAAMFFDYNLTALSNLPGDQQRGNDTIRGLVKTGTWFDNLQQDSCGMCADKGWHWGLPESSEAKCWGDPLVDTISRLADDSLRLDRLVAALDTPKIAWGSWYYTYPGQPDAGYRLRYSTDNGQTWTLAHASLPGGRGYDGVVGGDSAYWGQCPGNSWERMLYEIPVVKGSTFSLCWEYVDLFGGFYPGVLIDYIEGFGFPAPASVTETKTFPPGFRLSVAPNPFHGTTHISYSLPQAGKVSVKLYNVMGALVRTLVEGRCAAGAYTATVDARLLVRGVYILKFASGSYRKTAKLIRE